MGWVFSLTPFNASSIQRPIRGMPCHACYMLEPLRQFINTKNGWSCRWNHRPCLPNRSLCISFYIWYINGSTGPVDTVIIETSTHQCHSISLHHSHSIQRTHIDGFPSTDSTPLTDSTLLPAVLLSPTVLFYRQYFSHRQYYDGLSSGFFNARLRGRDLHQVRRRRPSRAP